MNQSVVLRLYDIKPITMIFSGNIYLHNFMILYTILKNFFTRNLISDFQHQCWMDAIFFQNMWSIISMLDNVRM